MKVQIRQGVFETNSSSTHSLTMCTSEVYDEWIEGKLLKNDSYRLGLDGDFVTREEAIKVLLETGGLNEEDLNYEDTVDDALEEAWLLTYSKYWSSINEEYETFNQTFKTPKGEEVVSFGYYGSNY